jgi:hypothetical protein
MAKEHHNSDSVIVVQGVCKLGANSAARPGVKKILHQQGHLFKEFLLHPKLELLSCTHASH